MKNKGIVIFLVILGVIIIAIVAGDFISTRPDKQKGNPYKLNIDEFRNIDTNLVLYRETKNFEVGMDSLKGIAYNTGLIYLAGDKKIQVIDRAGKLLNEIALSAKPSCIQVGEGKIVVGLREKVAVFNTEGKLISEWPPFGENTVITSIALKGELVYIADAGLRRVLRYRITGEKLNEFEGKNSNEDLHGFIVPSPYFDLAVNTLGELWVVNPGNHSLENYSDDGMLRDYWKRSSMKIEDFSGCCNPAHFTFLPDGNFVTSEKGLVRIKVYKPSGDFIGVVAPTSGFEEEMHAPDLAADEDGNVYALDFERKVIRIFSSLKK